MTQRKVMTSGMLLLCLLLIVGVVGVSALATSAVNWRVIGGGGGSSSSASYRVDGTIGQAATGSSVGAQYRVTGGFWAGMTAAGGSTTQQVMIPLIIKS